MEDPAPLAAVLALCAATCGAILRPVLREPGGGGELVERMRADLGLLQSGAEEEAGALSTFYAAALVAAVYVWQGLRGADA